MKTRVSILAIALLLILLALGVACCATPIASAQEEEPDPELTCPPCDASLVLEVLGECLVEEDGITVGYGILRILNDGSQGLSIGTIQAYYTEGGGEIIPQEIVFWLGPGETIEQQFKVIPTETRPDGSIQIRWEVTQESCRPYHNIGKGDTVDFEGCPTAIELTIFTAQSGDEPESLAPPWQVIAVSVALASIVAFVAWRFPRPPTQ